MTIRRTVFNEEFLSFIHVSLSIATDAKKYARNASLNRPLCQIQILLGLPANGG